MFDLQSMLGLMIVMADNWPVSRPALLPLPEPMLVLVGSADPKLLRQVDRRLANKSNTMDIRSNVLWIEVPDGRAFLESVLSDIAEDRKHVRLAFADPNTDINELVRTALLANTLVELAEALSAEELDLAPLDYQIRYQPIVRLSNRSVIGFEALLRAHSGNKLISAERLISRAAEGGWLTELDQLSRQLAIKSVGSWLGSGLLFLNIMAPDGTFDLAAARRTIRHAENAGLEPDQIVFETAERNRYPDIPTAAAQLERLRDAGVRLAVDDVGDGYSSLRVATSFKPDILKLAGHLTKSLPSPESTAIVKAVVDLAHHTGTWVVAENVETEEQADILRSLSVDWGQGNLFGRPEPKELRQ